MGFAQLMTMPIAALGQLLTLEVLFPILALIVMSIVFTILFTQRRIWRATVTVAPPPVAASPGAVAGG